MFLSSFKSNYMCVQLDFKFVHIVTDAPGIYHCTDCLAIVSETQQLQIEHDAQGSNVADVKRSRNT